MVKILKIKKFYSKFGGVIVGRCDFFYYETDISGNKSLKTRCTSSENRLISKIFRVSKITPLLFFGWVIKWTVCFPNNKEN